MDILTEQTTKDGEITERQCMRALLSLVEIIDEVHDDLMNVMETGEIPQKKRRDRKGSSKTSPQIEESSAPEEEVDEPAASHDDSDEDPDDDPDDGLDFI